MSTMPENNLYGNMVMHVVLSPALDALGKKNESAAQTLRSSFYKAERRIPGFSYNFLRHLLLQSNLLQKVDFSQTLLRLGGQAESDEFTIPRTDPVYQELNIRCSDLRQILGHIPNQIADKKQFLETIKLIAGRIKLLLDSVNRVIENMAPHMVESGTKQVLEDSKKEFVRNSKKFSNTLKDYFRDTSQNESVFISAIYLIHQTIVILKTVRQDMC